MFEPGRLLRFFSLAIASASCALERFERRGIRTCNGALEKSMDISFQLIITQNLGNALLTM